MSVCSAYRLELQPNVCATFMQLANRDLVRDGDDWCPVEREANTIRYEKGTGMDQEIRIGFGFALVHFNNIDHPF